MTTVLRSDGNAEFYCDYVFIETSQLWEKPFDKESSSFLTQKIINFECNFNHIVLQIEETEGEKVNPKMNNKTKRKAG